ncbi:hypothetical protein niasHT_032177 [Heterodera trifolii]|uniref:Uncharacterized protein n=1 Tax=Heterodera trifolii TaxID=157864 RepID=A0ABD2HRX0_9BILA
MVQTYQSPVRVYKHPFELVMAAYHKRFPTCPQIPIFVGSEITYEWRAEDEAEEIIERKCQLNVDAPYLVKKIAGVDFVYFKQRNHLNMRQRTLLIEASNISFSSRIVVVENCKYYVHTENPEWTCFEQSASLDVKSFFGFEAAVEKLAVKQYGANIAKGKEVLEYFIEELIKSGVTFIAPWKSDGGGEDTGSTKVDDLHHALGTDSAIDVSSTDGAESGGGKSSAMASEHGGVGGTTARMPTAAVAAERCASPTAGGAAASSSAGTSAPVVAAEAASGTASAEPAAVILGGDAADAPPLSGTAEEMLSTEELKRRRSSGAGGTKAALNLVVVSGAGGDSAGTKLVADRTRSFDDLESKLESEYIQRFLGQLTPLEESRLCELKYGLQSMHKGKMPNDAHLLRFLRARDFDVQKATQLTLNSLLWRKQHKIDSLLDDFVPPAVFKKYFPGGWHHNDSEGRPLFILRLGQMDIKGLLRSVGLQSIVKFTLSICEQGLNKSAEATHRLGKPISTWTLLVDLDGLSMRHLWRPGVQCLLRIIEIVEAHYPETMGLVLITRAPRVFPVLWTLVSPFIDENTRKKFELYASEDVLKELGRYIPSEFLPDFLGGPAHFEQSVATAQPPWTVPKTEYLPIPSDELMRESAENCLTNAYTNVTVNRGAPYEIYVWIDHAGSVLTWDFDITKGECEFVIYRTEKKIAAPLHSHQQQKHSSASFSATAAPPPNAATSSTTATAGGAGAVASGGGGGSATVSSSVAATVMGPVERVVDEISNLLSSAAGGSSSGAHAPQFHAIIGEPTFRVGVELFLAQQPLSFGEGDSMQGSHYCLKLGTYILQWRHPADSPPAPDAAAATAASKTPATGTTLAAKPSNITVLDTSGGTETAETTAPSLAANIAEKQQHKSGGGGAGSSSSSAAAHKCRLMVYHEVLNSADFKGSVVSLQSCRSSFNSLAAGESMHSVYSNPSPNVKQRNHNNNNIIVTGQTGHNKKGKKKDANNAGEEEEEEDTSTDQTPKAVQ